MVTWQLAKIKLTDGRVSEVTELPGPLVVNGSVLVARLFLVHVTVIFPRFETRLVPIIIFIDHKFTISVVKFDDFGMNLKRLL